MIVAIAASSHIQFVGVLMSNHTCVFWSPMKLSVTSQASSYHHIQFRLISTGCYFVTCLSHVAMKAPFCINTHFPFYILYQSHLKVIN